MVVGGYHLCGYETKTLIEKSTRDNCEMISYSMCYLFNKNTSSQALYDIGFCKKNSMVDKFRIVI
jgi:hypothetical protein